MLKNILSLFITTTCFSATTIEADKPNILSFPAAKAKFVRFVIYGTSQNQPCIDELEVYSPDNPDNLALSANGAKATASSCLQGYTIHKTAHLNDGHYGNSFSWIAAGTQNEWAQIELPRIFSIDRIIFSRDRKGKYKDRIPVRFKIKLSTDGKTWRTVRRVRSAGIPMLPENNFEWSELLHYAFECEAASFKSVDSSDPVARVIKQFDQMIERFSEQGLSVSAERAELKELQKQQKATLESGRQKATLESGRQKATLESGRQKTTPESGQQKATLESKKTTEQLFFAARMAKRQLFLRNPDLSAINKILFVKRHAFRPTHNYSVILDAAGPAGGAVCRLEIPRTKGRFTPHHAQLVPLFSAESGIVRNPMANFEATRIYFAHCTKKGDYYHLMVMNRDGSHVKQLTDGPYHDYWPCPLPDGGLTFISTRCKCRFLCWRPQAFVLFRMDVDGTNIRPLSYANLSEWAPSVMRDGRIIWTRSEYIDKGADFGHTLWAIRPDGTHPKLIFGNNTINCYANAREVPGTDEICCTLISHGGDLNGPIALINTNKGRFNPKAITNITQDVAYHTHMSWAKQACFRDPVPISRDLVLCSHAPQNLFGLYIIDRFGNREIIYLDPAIDSMCPTPFHAVKTPPVIPSSESSEQENVVNKDTGPGYGQFLLVDVYRGLEPTVKRGTIKYIRVCQEIRSDLAKLPTGEYRNDHVPFQDFYASPTHIVTGPNGWPSYTAKATLGIAHVEEDGSANFYAPAGKVLYFQALDEKFNEVQRMRSVIQMQPGEKRSCTGCHEKRSTSAPRHHGIALRREAEHLTPPPWGTGPFSYERIVQPVWNKNCIQCHNSKDKNKINLTGIRDKERVPASFRTIIERGWVHYFTYHYHEEHNKAMPLTFGSVKSSLVKLLDSHNHYNVKLSRKDFRRIKCWIDLNCPLWPDYRFRMDRPEQLVSYSKDSTE